MFFTALSYRKEGWQATTLCWIFRNRRLQTAFLPEGRPCAAGVPQRGGLPGVQRRVSTNEAEAAPAVAAGQHE